MGLVGIERRRVATPCGALYWSRVRPLGDGAEGDRAAETMGVYGGGVGETPHGGDGAAMPILGLSRAPSTARRPLGFGSPSFCGGDNDRHGTRRSRTRARGTAQRKAAAKAGIETEKDPFSEANLTNVIKDYMPLVRHAVNRIAVGSTNGGILQYEDMVSYGVQGLIEAYYAFDPNKGAKFSTYALPRIRGSILDAIRATHPLPRSLQKFGSDMEKATSALHVKLNRAPTRDELAEHMGIEPRDFMASLRTSNVRVVSLDSLADSRRERQRARSCGRWRTTTRTSTPTRWPKRRWCARKLAEAVELLPERETDDRPAVLHEVAVAEEHRRGAGHLGVACVAVAAPCDPAAAHGAGAGTAGRGVIGRRARHLRRRRADRPGGGSPAARLARACEGVDARAARQARAGAGVGETSARRRA